MHLFCSFMYHDHCSCSLLKRMRKKRKKNITDQKRSITCTAANSNFSTSLNITPCDSILFLSEIRSSANRLISDSVLAIDTNDVSLYLQDGERHFKCTALL